MVLTIVVEMSVLSGVVPKCSDLHLTLEHNSSHAISMLHKWNCRWLPATLLWREAWLSAIIRVVFRGFVSPPSETFIKISVHIYEFFLAFTSRSSNFGQKHGDVLMFLINFINLFSKAACKLLCAMGLSRCVLVYPLKLIFLGKSTFFLLNFVFDMENNIFHYTSTHGYCFLKYVVKFCVFPMIKCKHAIWFFLPENLNHYLCEFLFLYDSSYLHFILVILPFYQELKISLEFPWVYLLSHCIN